jgi:hypothetical protein
MSFVVELRIISLINSPTVVSHINVLRYGKCTPNLENARRFLPIFPRVVGGGGSREKEKESNRAEMIQKHLRNAKLEDILHNLKTIQFAVSAVDCASLDPKSVPEGERFFCANCVDAEWAQKKIEKATHGKGKKSGSGKNLRNDGDEDNNVVVAIRKVKEGKIG